MAYFTPNTYVAVSSVHFHWCTPPPARRESPHPGKPPLGLPGSLLPGRPDNLLKPPELARRDLPVVPGVVQQFKSHRPGMRVLVLQKISNFPLVFPGGPRIPVSGRGITDSTANAPGVKVPFGTSTNAEGGRMRPMTAAKLDTHAAE